MTNDEQFIKEIQRKDIEITCIYIGIFCSLLYLIIFYKERAALIDKQYGTNYQEKYPDTTNYSKIIIVLLAVTNCIFFYYSYIDLQNGKEKYKKTGDDTGLEALYFSFYANVFQLTGTLIGLYNIFVNEDETINVLF